MILLLVIAGWIFVLSVVAGLCAAARAGDLTQVTLRGDLKQVTLRGDRVAA